MISVAWLVGVLRNVPIKGSFAARRCRNDGVDEVMRICPLLEDKASWHRIIVGVEDPSRLLREVDPRRAEYIDQLVDAAADRFRRMHRRRRDDRDRRTAAQFVIVIPPVVLVDGPWPAQVVDKLPLE